MKMKNDIVANKKISMVIGIVCIFILLTFVISKAIFSNDHVCPEPPEQRTIEELYADTQPTIKGYSWERECDIELIGREPHKQSFYKNVYIRESNGGYAKFSWDGNDITWGGKYLVTSRSWMDTVWNEPKTPSLYGEGNVLLNGREGRMYIYDDTTFIWVENNRR